MPFSIETIDKVYDEQIKKIDYSMLKYKEMIETRNRELRELYKQIFQQRAELIKLIEKANNKLEMLRIFVR
jgi:hypothetical protein